MGLYVSTLKVFILIYDKGCIDKDRLITLISVVAALVYLKMNIMQITCTVIPIHNYS